MQFTDTCNSAKDTGDEKRLAALGSRWRDPPHSGERAWSFRVSRFSVGIRILLLCYCKITDTTRKGLLISSEPDFRR